MGDGEHAWNDLEYGVGYSNMTNEPGNNENLAISQKGVTELVRGIKDGMTASEYPNSYRGFCRWSYGNWK